ncbi:KAT8 regulatory NSL complex subunit 1-like [Dreissena polymorpha]|uniref:PEHE domain-containing protein n=1 Tax=Dreissena polymorpha TaxID=45954 RepID=A0A9D3YJB3_DREPO|nr:KAT8 regulatory NSL complex subunit 1-like [Dreissena polymorpha]KAH3701592.1 hypothetical protein DPMN_076581 [Dreissena polymorpha]
MAPALTETTGQSCIQLPGSTPTAISDSLINNNNHNITDTNGFYQYSKKIDISLVRSSSPSFTSETKTPHGVLAPLLKQQTYINGKVNKGLQDNWLQSIPDIVRQFEKKADKIYPSFVLKKMNQPSNENGPNGTGKRFLKQTSLIEEKALNGHAAKNCEDRNVTKRLNHVNGKNYIGSNGETSLVNLQHKSANMCQITDSGSGKPAFAAASSSQQRGNDLALKGSGVKIFIESNLKVQETEQTDPTPADLVKDASRKQHMLERKSQFLIRRLRRLQGRQLDNQVSSQLKSFVHFQHQNLQVVATKAIRPWSEGVSNSFFNSNDVKNLSTSNLVTLVRKLQASQPKPLHDIAKKNNRKGVLVMEKSVSSESERKSGQLRMNVRHWNDAVDEEATESSSGGESCEEWEDCPVMSDKKAPIPLYKRSEWKWAVDRAAIVARWTWLQAQVSDLEYRIRQQSEIYKTIRSSKGVVTLCDVPQTPFLPSGDMGFIRNSDMSPANIASLMINVNKQASKLSQSLGPCLSPATPQQDSLSARLGKDAAKSLNGYVESSHRPQTIISASVTFSGDSSTSSPDLNSAALEASCVAARCRPVRFDRKRKLLRTTGLHHFNHKAARLSSVNCQCYPPVMPCPMCGGRYNNMQKLDAESMPITEKVSLLDPSYHPVLSFPQEIGLPLHFEALLKSGEWQSTKAQPKLTLRSIAAEKRRQKQLNAQMKDQVRKNRKKYNKTAAAVLLSSAKLRSKYEGKSPSKMAKKITGESLLRRTEIKKRKAQMAAASLRKTSYVHGDTDMESVGSLGQAMSPSPQNKDGSLSFSASSSSLKDMKEARKKRFENAYDINNIVIPYSMAASTRVEKLQYKEIQTPKWREVDGLEETDLETSEAEDVTDEAFTVRHDVPEAEERKRFRNFITYPPVRRSRTSRESESNNTENFAVDCPLGESFSSMDLQAAGFSFSGLKEDGRRRSGSTSRRGSFMEEFGVGLGGQEYLFDSWRSEPFPERIFPLDETMYEKMKQEQLTASRTKNKYRRRRTVKLQDDPAMEFVSPEVEATEDLPYVDVASPGYSGSTDSNMEDFNDPEWNEGQGERRSSLSTKHSKR